MKKYKKDNWFQLSALIPKPTSEVEEEGWKSVKAGSKTAGWKCVKARWKGATDVET